MRQLSNLFKFVNNNRRMTAVVGIWGLVGLAFALAQINTTSKSTPAPADSQISEAAPVAIEEVAETALGQLPLAKDVQTAEVADFKEKFDITPEVISIQAEYSPVITSDKTDKILTDYQSMIDPKFKIPEILFTQTKFWFRVYTEFDSRKKIIHDSLHPHIIYDVVDISEILKQPARASWLNVAKADKMVARRAQEIRTKLAKMASKKKEQMDAEELAWMNQFDQISGNKKQIISAAAQNVRVQTGQKDHYKRALNTSGLYLDGMETIFRSKKLPIELTRLPFVESSFVIGATSKVGAAGIWQFMPSVGRKTMLIDDHIDERRNPWKATHAAATLLKENYSILYKDWGLSLTAYNHGPGGVRKAIHAVNSKDIGKIVKSYRSKNFDFASANFYTCFLAALHAYTYRNLIWPSQEYSSPLKYDTMVLKKATAPNKVLAMTGLTEKQILEFNPELDRAFRRQIAIPAGYKLFVPNTQLALNGGPVAEKQN